MTRDLDRVREEYWTILAQEKDQEAFSLLFKRVNPDLTRFAQSLLKDDHVAADVVQESWISIHRSLPHLRDPAAFRGWACRVVSRRCADYIRQKQRRRERETKSIDASDIPEEHIPTEQEARLRELINELAPDRRGLIELVYHQNLSLHEVVIALDLPLGTVKSRLGHHQPDCRPSIIPVWVPITIEIVTETNYFSPLNNTTSRNFRFFLIVVTCHP
jgi:RNA polymerase sigma-70 factor (ECF subfamily)